MKKILCIFVTCLLTFGTSIPSFAETDETPAYAVLLNNGLNIHNSMRIEGDIVVANGTVLCDKSGSNRIAGNIYISPSVTYSDELAVNNAFDGEIITQDISFDKSDLTLTDIPTIENKADKITAGWSGSVAPISANTGIGTLTVNSKITFDTSASDVYVTVDKLIMGNSGSIEVSGDNTLYLFIKSNLSMSGSSSINKGGDSAKIQFFVNGTLTLSGNSSVFANTYIYGEDVTLTGSGSITGNVIATAKTFSVKNGTKITGAVYAPKADAVVASSGEINGSLIANSLDIFGSGKITNNKNHTGKPNIPAPAIKHKLSVNVVPVDHAGTVLPNYGLYNYGEVVSLSVASDEEFDFEGFEGSSEVVDDTVQIVGDTTLIAKFAKKTTEAPIELNYSYAYLYGYHDGNVGAEDDVKRAEASSLIYRLIKQNNQLGGFVSPEDPTFADVGKGTWSYNAIEFMTYKGAFSLSNRLIYPEVAITRGEAAKIVSVSLGIVPNTDAEDSLAGFTDIDISNPYYYYIKALYDSNLMIGSSDTSIEPDAHLTRAEFITIINRIISRDDNYDIADAVNPYPDLTTDKWYYENIIRASNGFSQDATGKYNVDPEKKQNREDIDY